MAPPDDDDIDPKVKDLIDLATQAELQKWFGLPSFEELADKGVPPPAEDPDVVAVREQREKAMAAIDPALLEAHRKRTEPPELQFKPTIELRVDPSVALLDLGMIERQHVIGEPREIEIPEAIHDDLAERTPQAILRDLHRPELDFEKIFEVVDYGAEQRLDIVAEVAAAMATSWKLPRLEGSPFREAREIMADLKAERRRSWPELLAAKPLPNRRFDKEHDR